MPCLFQPSNVQAPPPELLRFCLTHLANFIGVPALFGEGFSRARPKELDRLHDKLAANSQLTPHEVAKLLVLWLGAMPVLLPDRLQLELLENAVLSDSTAGAKLVFRLQKCLAMMDAHAAATVWPLLLFLQQYLLHQHNYEQELQHMADVFAPLLFSSARTQGASCILRSTRLTAFIISQAMAIFSRTPTVAQDPQSCDTAAAPTMPAAAAMTAVNCHSCTAGNFDNDMSACPQTQPEGDDIWLSDPVVCRTMDSLVNFSVTSALFDDDSDDAVIIPGSTPATHPDSVPNPSPDSTLSAQPNCNATPAPGGAKHIKPACVSGVEVLALHDEQLLTHCAAASRSRPCYDIVARAASPVSVLPARPTLSLSRAWLLERPVRVNGSGKMPCGFSQLCDRPHKRTRHRKVPATSTHQQQLALLQPQPPHGLMWRQYACVTGDITEVVCYDLPHDRLLA